VEDFRAALELATEEELQDLTQLLFQPRFNPLDYLNTPHPIEIQSRNRRRWLEDLETRFCYLAADGVTVLRGQTRNLSYRDVLIRICQYLHVTYSEAATAIDIEAEIFLHLLGQAWKRLPGRDRDALTRRIQTALSQSNYAQPLPLSVQRDPVRWLVGGGSAIAVGAVIKPLVLHQIARQFAVQFARHQLAQQSVKGGAAAAAQFQGFVAMQMARRGMAINTARYATTRTVFAAVGPLLWAWLFADIGWRAIATNYGRIIPAVFALAQIRLTREDAWQYAS
jgi:uncharacterized protein YaaW (UPF0174 family)